MRGSCEIKRISQKGHLELSFIWCTLCCHQGRTWISRVKSVCLSARKRRYEHAGLLKRKCISTTRRFLEMSQHLIILCPCSLCIDVEVTQYRRMYWCFAYFSPNVLWRKWKQLWSWLYINYQLDALIIIYS